LINELLKQKDDCDDILIIKNGLVTDTSIGNILFLDGKQWITPDSPLLPGTSRARLINEGIVQEKKIQLSNISKFLGFQVVNALIPFSHENQNSIENIHL
jgi:4-amino-4-deoxychorismate lyase